MECIHNLLIKMFKEINDRKAFTFRIIKNNA